MRNWWPKRLREPNSVMPVAAGIMTRVRWVPSITDCICDLTKYNINLILCFLLNIEEKGNKHRYQYPPSLIHPKVNFSAMLLLLILSALLPQELSSIELSTITCQSPRDTYYRFGRLLLSCFGIQLTFDITFDVYLCVDVFQTLRIIMQALLL